MTEFVKVDSNDKIKQLAGLAKEIWNEHYIKILSQEQIDYMLEKFQSENAIKEQISNDGYNYYFINSDSKIAGFVGFCPKNDYLFLSKIYLKSEMRGKGLGREGIEFVENYAREHGFNSIRLTVNKYNMTSVYVYNNLGFQKIDDVVTDIGNGFVMDDYIMEKTLS